MDRDKFARCVVEELFDDIADRKGIGNALDDCDEDIKEEIKRVWCAIVEEIMADNDL